jgi:hypothetical protein
VGLWTPAARGLGTYEGTSVLGLVYGGVLVSVLALVAPRWGAWVLAVLGGLGAGLLVASGTGVAVSATSVAVTAASAVAGMRWLAPRLPDLSAFQSNSWVVVAWALGAAALLLTQSARIAVFIGDPSFVAGAVLPHDPVLSRHACMTAYLHGSILVDHGANPYDLVFMASDPLSATLPATAAHFAPFTLDLYGYGPPFLLVPRMMRVFTEDFITLRAVFSTGSVVLAFAAMAALAWQLGGITGRRIWLLGPLALCTSPVLAAVSVGNFHLALVAMCALAWVAFERHQGALGGGLLAFGILSKIAPGLLGVVLLARRQWTAAAATLVAAAVLSLLALPASGLGSWVDFFTYHLPNLSTGEALGFLDDDPQTVAFNMAPFGIPFKLAAMGRSELGWAEARLINHAYTLGLLAIGVVAGLRGVSAPHRAIAWMAVLTLATLRSPYAPPYVLSGMVFALVIMGGEIRTRWQGGLFVLASLMFTVPLPLPPVEGMPVTLVRQLLFLAMICWMAVRGEATQE